MHRCHAYGCSERCKPEHLMCAKHWRKVPASLQREVWKHYRSGQCDDRRPSKEWHRAASAAIASVALKDGLGITKAEFAALQELHPKSLGAAVFQPRQLGLFSDGGDER